MASLGTAVSPSQAAVFEAVERSIVLPSEVVVFERVEAKELAAGVSPTRRRVRLSGTLRSARIRATIEAGCARHGRRSSVSNLYSFHSAVSKAPRFTGECLPHSERAQKAANGEMFLWSYPQFLDRRNDAGYIRGEG